MPDLPESFENALPTGGVTGSEKYAEVDDDGNLRIPATHARAMGFHPGARIKLSRLSDRLVLHRPIGQLTRVYVEPTTACNLNCITCMRNVWEEPVGRMDWATFERVLAGIRALPEPPTLFFGGLGEPFTHPDLLDMIREAKRLEASVEVITNGTLLNEARAEALIDLGLDTLWISVDGASPECYADVRQENGLPRVMANLERLRDLKIRKRCARPTLGISFVAMRRNLAELPEVLRLEHRVGARNFLVSNVYPHTPELLREILYRRSIGESLWSRSTIRMGRMDPNRDVAALLQSVVQGLYGPRLEGTELLWSSDTCPFVSRGSTCVRWDGQVSPCLPLLHTHTSYLEDRLRTHTAYAVGSLRERSLLELWAAPDYVALRKRLEDFDFSPCTACNSCEKADGNQEDCFGNTTPSCGGCLWAQGFILCP
ncbi:MAG: radical SAM protein [candidate division NC10 bacterium]|nr:radical SAM protein [candidate division NC10 bacterium]